MRPLQWELALHISRGTSSSSSSRGQHSYRLECTTIYGSRCEIFPMSPIASSTYKKEFVMPIWITLCDISFLFHSSIHSHNVEWDFVNFLWSISRFHPTQLGLNHGYDTYLMLSTTLLLVSLHWYDISYRDFEKNIMSSHNKESYIGQALFNTNEISSKLACCRFLESHIYALSRKFLFLEGCPF